MKRLKNRIQLRPQAAYLDRFPAHEHVFAMSTKKRLTAEAMALPLAEKVWLAQALWQSIDAGLPDANERSALREAARRDQELSNGKVSSLAHDEAMKAVRRALGCK